MRKIDFMSDNNENLNQNGEANGDSQAARDTRSAQNSQSAREEQAAQAARDNADSRMSTVEHAKLLQEQNEVIARKVSEAQPDTPLEEAIDPSNSQFGPKAHPEQVQMRVAKRALMLKEGLEPYPVKVDVTDTIEQVRKRYEGKLEDGAQTEDVVGVAGRVIFLRNAGGLCGRRRHLYSGHDFQARNRRRIDEAL